MITRLKQKDYDYNMHKHKDYTTLEHLVGDHVLTGVDYGSHWEGKGEKDYNDASCFRLLLDGDTLTVTEDENDGYRSALGSVEVEFKPEHPIKNTFPSVEVNCVHENSGCSILNIYDKSSGLLLMKFGTDNTDDYYPSFVGVFFPENLPQNRGFRAGKQFGF